MRHDPPGERNEHDLPAVADGCPNRSAPRWHDLCGPDDPALSPAEQLAARGAAVRSLREPTQVLDTVRPRPYVTRNGGKPMPTTTTGVNRPSCDRVRRRLVDAAIRHITREVMPVERIPRHSAVVELTVWHAAGMLTGTERVEILLRFPPGPAEARYGDHFTPLPRAVCMCGRQIVLVPKRTGNGEVWEHDPDHPQDHHLARPSHR